MPEVSDQSPGDHSDDIIIRGNTLGPRWQRFRELNNSAARILGKGRLNEAQTLLEAAYRETLVDDVDAAGLDARARALSNLMSVSDSLGRAEDSLRQAAEALAVCDTVLSEVGDRYGTKATKASLLINRAQTLHAGGRLNESLADLDAAMELSVGNGPENDGMLGLNLHNSRAVTLTALERWEEAEAEARLTLELASQVNPLFAGHPYHNLAAIKQATGDFAAAEEFMQLAAEIHQAGGQHASQAMAIANLGRLAMRRGDFAEADSLYTRAEATFIQGQEQLNAAEVRYSRGVLALNQGDFAQALVLLTEAAESMRPAEKSASLAECLGLIADLRTSEGAFPEAERSYQESRAIHLASGTMVNVTRIDGRRAVARYVQATVAGSPIEQERLLREALDLALPAALATDAVRHRFSPGPTRERWTVTVAGPAMSMAFALAVSMNDSALLWELVENASATISLQPDPALNPIQSGLAQAMEPLQSEAMPSVTVPPTNRPDTVSPGQNPQAHTGVAMEFELVAGGDLPFTASALWASAEETAGYPTPRLALPPRLRIDPDRQSVLAEWIDLAEQRYGFPVRAQETIDSW